MGRIVHLSDLHFAKIEPGSAEAVLDAVRSLAPDLVIVSGDLTLAGRRHEFIAARKFLDQIERPLIVVPGNHDVPAFNVGLRFSCPMWRFHRHITRDRTPSIVGPEWCVLGLNTARAWDLSWNWSHGRFSAEQVRAADEFFAAHAESPFKCLVMHHPFFLPDGLKGFKIVGRAPEMLRVLGKRGVDIVLAGHLHRGFWRAHEDVAEDRHHHVLVIQASTAMSHRRRDEPNAFNQIEIEGDTLTLTPWTRESGAFEPRVATRFERTVTGWGLVTAANAGLPG